MSCTPTKSAFTGYYEINGLPQGSDINIPIAYKTGSPATIVDLSGYSAKLQVRRNYDSPVLIELSSADGTITLSATSPNVTLHFSNSLTEGMTVFNDMIYDLEITSPSGSISRILQGPFSISRQVTR